MFVNLRNLSFFLQIPQVYEHFLAFHCHPSLLLEQLRIPMYTYIL